MNSLIGSIASFIVIGFLTGCSTPRFPEGESCAIIWDQSFEKSFLYCRDHVYEKAPRYITLEAAAKSGMVCESVEFWAEILQWRNDVEKELKLRREL